MVSNAVNSELPLILGSKAHKQVGNLIVARYKLPAHPVAQDLESKYRDGLCRHIRRILLTGQVAHCHSSLASFLLWMQVSKFKMFEVSKPGHFCDRDSRTAVAADLDDALLTKLLQELL